MRRKGHMDGKKDREEEIGSGEKRDVKRAGGKYGYEARRKGRRGEGHREGKEDKEERERRTEMRGEGQRG
jgi:hypothetical protein